MNSPMLLVSKQLIDIESTLLERLPKDLISVVNSKVLEMEKVAQAIDLSKDVCSFRYGHTGLKEILDGTYYFNLLLKRDVSVARVHKLILHLLPALEIEIKCSALITYSVSIQSSENS